MNNNQHDSQLLLIADQIPYSVRTLGRAKILITLSQIQPAPIHQFMYYNFKKSTTSRILREMNRESLTFERYRLHRLTDLGLGVVNLLLKESIVGAWLVSNTHTYNWFKEKISRPKIRRIR